MEAKKYFDINQLLLEHIIVQSSVTSSMKNIPFQGRYWCQTSANLYHLSLVEMQYFSGFSCYHS